MVANCLVFRATRPGGVFKSRTCWGTPEHLVRRFQCPTAGARLRGLWQEPDAPFLTLDYAVSQCTASKGNVVYLMPGHAETISSAALSHLGGCDRRGRGWSWQGTKRATFTFLTWTATSS